MRKIERGPAPQSLRASALTDLKRDLNRHFDLEREVRHRRRAPFDREWLLRPDVLKALQVFDHRCAYCESRVTSTEENLDHFRPVTGSRHGQGRSPSPDHYGWFAYEWRNLLIVCAACRRVREDAFPLNGPPAPLMCSWTDANKLEEVQLIDPTLDDPLIHLALRSDGQLEALSERGAITLELFALNRSNLRSERAGQIDRLRSGFADNSQSARSWLERQVLRTEERPGIALLFVRTLSRNLRLYYRLSERTSPSFLKVLPDFLHSVPRNEWLQALELYQSSRSDAYESVAVEDKFLAARRDDVIASARVRTVTIRNFKGIEDLTLNLSAAGESSFQAPCTMLLGENATCKSTVLQALCLALMAPTKRRGLKLDAEEFLSREKSNWRLTGVREASVSVELDDGLSAELRVDSDHAAFVGEGMPFLLVFAYGARRLFTSRRARSGGTDAVKTLFKPLSTIRDPTSWLQRCTPEQFDAVARAMFEVLSLDRDDNIFKDDDGNVMVRAHGRSAPITQMSDGYKSLFAMAVDIMCRMVEYWGNLESARGLVLIDEIETHLHPRWKMQVMGALRRALPQVQFVATTHDPLCLRGMRDGEVHVLYRNEAGDVDELEDLPSVEGLRAEQLLTSDYFGLATTSDPEIERLLDNYVERSSGGSDGQNSDNEVLRASLARTLSERTVIGDDASQQVVAEALARYLAMRRDAAPMDRRKMREDAIRAVLDVLNARTP